MSSPQANTREPEYSQQAHGLAHCQPRTEYPDHVAERATSSSGLHNDAAVSDHQDHLPRSTPMVRNDRQASSGHDHPGVQGAYQQSQQQYPGQHQHQHQQPTGAVAQTYSTAREWVESPANSYSMQRFLSQEQN